MIHSGIRTSSITWNAYINSCEGAEWGRILILLRQMQLVGLQQSPATLTPAVNAAGVRSCWTRAISFLVAFGRYDLILLNSAIVAYSMGHHWKAAQSFLETMRELRCCDKASLSAAVTSCEKAKAWRCGLQLVQELLHMPDSIGCSSQDLCRVGLGLRV